MSKHHCKAAEAAKPQRREKRIGRKAVANPDLKVASDIRAAIRRKEDRAKSVFGIYALETSPNCYSLPFAALNDDLALQAQKQLLPRSNCYAIGTYCIADGRLTAHRYARLVLDNGVHHDKV